MIRRPPKCTPFPYTTPFRFLVDGTLHAALITAGTAKHGFRSVTVDGKQLTAGQAAAFGSFSVSHLSSHAVSITTEHFDIELSNNENITKLPLHLNLQLSILL